MSPLLDTHHHFDFLQGPELRAEFLQELAKLDVRIVAQTLTPSSFMELLAEGRRFEGAGVPLPLWSVGFHPWYIEGEAHAEAELDVFSEALTQTRFIGEIGLDFSPRRVANSPAAVQERVFRRVLRSVCEAASQASDSDPYVLSIHAVRAAGRVLDLLDEVSIAERNVAPVFHWFSGTSDELTRLVRLGGYVSVHPRMLESKRGRAYVKQVPADRLLLETDLPEQVGNLPSEVDVSHSARAAADELVSALTSNLSILTDLRGTDMTRVLMRNQSHLYGVG